MLQEDMCKGMCAYVCVSVRACVCVYVQECLSSSHTPDSASGRHVQRCVCV